MLNMDSLLTGSSDSKWDILGYNSMYMNVDSPGAPLDVIQHCVYFKQHWEMVSFHEREREGVGPFPFAWTVPATFWRLHTSLYEDIFFWLERREKTSCWRSSLEEFTPYTILKALPSGVSSWQWQIIGYGQFKKNKKTAEPCGSFHCFVSLCVYCDKMHCMCMCKREPTKETRYSPNGQLGWVFQNNPSQIEGDHHLFTNYTRQQWNQSRSPNPLTLSFFLKTSEPQNKALGLWD